ncbi:Structural maintenance of chromosomes protein 5 [Psilocybe cubensis]|uniref:Structural maintenance of chromosomes protein 5 n=2 Tax=Psilocybe cubensis TaxID=181762 RepID=A0ACB8H4M3_PSICU|nr:Structural maintenance of chromosomes protein 5 [Psilocybe cubensis]KAH9482179.1 Structural maintenance of chromosomes protein 5 [Psilocybe cubensis]
MPRRATSPDATENTRSKREKVKVKEEKDKGKQRARVEEENEDDAQDEQEEENTPPDYEDEGEEGSPRGPKRRRTNVNGDSAPSGSGTQLPKRENVKTLPRGDDGYIPGSIVRIQLRNFVTYDFVEFFPGTHLNMIIGPNGTGKSSIACAIALGLNFPPSILGRSNVLGSYVKIGTEKGYIEIELKAPKGKKNYVIRRTIIAITNNSSFTLNGVSASGTEIKTKMAELNVQVGNLCSFLPQDRVSEFAGMSPQQLLKETQRAAGNPNLENWHDTLIIAGKEHREVQQKIKDEESTLKQMIERNEGIENDVARYKERKKIEHEIGLLNLLIPVAEYRESRVKYFEIKELQRKLHAKVQRLKEKNEPAHKRLKEMDANLKDTEKRREKLKDSTQKMFKDLLAAAEVCDELGVESDKIADKLVALKESEKEREKDIKSLTHEIAQLKEELNKPPPENLPKEADLQTEKTKLNAERNINQNKKMELDDLLKDVHNKIAREKQNQARAHAELTKLADDDAQKLNHIARWDRTAYEAILWVRKNRDLFKMEVFETPYMRVTMKDLRYANVLEACIGGQMRTFITQCQEDCDTINRLVNDANMFGPNGKITTWFRPYTEKNDTAPPMSREELRELRFDGYALDYLEFPPGMEWFLRCEVNLHRIPIALDERHVNVERAMDLVARSGGGTFFCGSTANKVSRSKYGDRLPLNLTSDVKPAKNLRTLAIDPDVQRQIKEAIAQAEMNLAIAEEEKSDINKRLDGVYAKDREFQQRHNEIKERSEQIKNELKRRQRNEGLLKAKSANLKKLKDAPSIEEKRKALREQLKLNAVQRAKHAREYTDLAYTIIAQHDKCTIAALEYMQISANKHALEELCNRKDKQYSDTLQEFGRVQEQYMEIKAQSKRALEETRKMLDEAPEDVRAAYDEIEVARVAWDNKLKEKESRSRRRDGDEDGDDESRERGRGRERERESEKEEARQSGVDVRTSDELKEELEAQSAKLELNLHTNAGVVELYEKRKRDIEQMTKTLEERKKKEAKIEKEIKTARDNWQPALEALVARIGAKFSLAFDRIGCAGEIRISQDADYEKWAINIFVKFRDGERLQQLTAHRQSGGERSLTTILYLMSLTEEARAPFSLVDEINQGMDQRAERAVHNSLVNVTCQADSAQYFLITPKLLPDLQYHERMKILCVYNGEWLPDDLPEDGSAGRMRGMLDLYEARHGRKGAAGRAGRGDI